MRAEVRTWGSLAHRVNRGYLHYADAIAYGRAGDRERAEAEAALGDADLAYLTWRRTYARRLLAEAALADGWGEPVAWLRDAIVFFDADGRTAIASACRALLRGAGEPVPRKGRGDAAVPAPLREAGVTSREMDVLLLVAEGLGNAEIAQRLFVSKRTVETHVASLLAKTGRADRESFAGLGQELSSVD